MTVQERFLHYVSFDTQSDENSPTCPSTAKQKLLGAAIVEEMKTMGIADAFMDADGYVYGTVPGDPSLPTIGLIAHMDTSPDASGCDVKAKIVEYRGGDVLLNEEKDIWLREKDYESLKNHHGKHLIVTPDDGCFEELTLCDRFDVDLNEGEPAQFHVQMPGQYHAYYKTGRKSEHHLRVIFRVYS